MPEFTVTDSDVGKVLSARPVVLTSLKMVKRGSSGRLRLSEQANPEKRSAPVVGIAWDHPGRGGDLPLNGGPLRAASLVVSEVPAGSAWRVVIA
jgi:hypothetical protein